MSVTEGNVSVARQMRVSMDFVLMEHGLFNRPICVGWACNVGSLELYSIQNGSLTDIQYRYRTSGHHCPCVCWCMGSWVYFSDR